jgi:hypothetical protein
LPVGKCGFRIGSIRIANLQSENIFGGRQPSQWTARTGKRRGDATATIAESSSQIQENVINHGTIESGNC